MASCHSCRSFSWPEQRSPSTALSDVQRIQRFTGLVPSFQSHCVFLFANLWFNWWNTAQVNTHLTLLYVSNVIVHFFTLIKAKLALAQRVLNEWSCICVSRSAPGCVAAAGIAGPIGEDRLEGPEPSPAGAFFLQRVAGGSVVPAQRQPRTWAWPPKAAAGPERRAATGSLIPTTQKASLGVLEWPLISYTQTETCLYILFLYL